jgi:serine/threonine protein kinase
LFSPLQSAAADFDHEIGIMAKLKHPNLVSMLHVVSKEEPKAIVLEFLAGGDLSAWLQDQGEAATHEDLVTIMHQIASGMAELERHGIGKHVMRREGGRVSGGGY